MNKPKICPECGSKDIELNNEGEVCKKCGLILNEKTYYSGERAII